MKRYTTACVVLLLSTLLPVEALAKKGKSSGFAAGSALSALGSLKIYDEDTLTVDALRSCLELEVVIDEAEKQLDIDVQPINRVEESMARAEDRLEKLDRYFAKNEDVEFYIDAELAEYNREVDRYNRIIAAFNEDLERYQRLEGPYNYKVDSYNAKIDSFDLECEGKSYYDEDYAKVADSIK
ncbi:hypothetical protein L4D20_13965 [Vibrio kyushuensis]|uniref:hypothetical protein n=1 Tax=Vibrio kyushuensis TaxID=2910249 RepID=UPI003D149E0F